MFSRKFLLFLLKGTDSIGTPVAFHSLSFFFFSAASEDMIFRDTAAIL